MNETTTNTIDQERALTEAIGHYLSAIELEPGAAHVRQELAGAHQLRAAARRQRGDLEGGLEDLLRARELAPGDERVVAALAETCAEVARLTPRSSANQSCAVSGPAATGGQSTTDVPTARTRIDPALASVARGHVLQLGRVLRHGDDRPRRPDDEGGPVEVSGNGELIAAVWHRHVELWERSSGKQITRMRAGRLRSMSMSSDGSTIAMSQERAEDREMRVRLWSVRSGSDLPEIETEPTHRDVVLSPSGSLLATGFYHAKDVDLWNVNSAELLWSVDQDRLRDLAFSPDGTQLLLAADHELDVMDIESGEGAFAIRDLPWRCEHACWLGEGRVLAVEGMLEKYRAILHVLDLATGQEVQRIETDGWTAPLVIADRVFLGSHTGRLDPYRSLATRILGFDLKTGSACEDLDLATAGLAFSREGLNRSGPLVVVAATDGSVLTFNISESEGP